MIKTSYKDKAVVHIILNFFNNTVPTIKALLYSRTTDNFHILGENKEEAKQRKKEVTANI